MPHPERPTAGPLLPWLVAGFLLVVVVIVYGQTLWFGFMNYDDTIFRHRLPRGAGRPDRQEYRLGPDQRPLGRVVSAGDALAHARLPMVRARGLAGITSPVCCCMPATVGLFFVLRAMTRELWPSALVAALFAVHPQHVESVAWIAERRDVLSGLFFVLTLAAYLGYVRSGRALGRYLLVVAALALGLMAKAMLVTVPAVLLLLDYWPLGRFGPSGDLPSGSACPLAKALAGWSSKNCR